MGIVRVPLGNRSYDIKIGTGLLARLGLECARLGLGSRCAVISDANVAPRFGSAAQKALVRAGFGPTLITIRIPIQPVDVIAGIEGMIAPRVHRTARLRFHTETIEQHDRHVHAPVAGLDHTLTHPIKVRLVVLRHIELQATISRRARSTAFEDLRRQGRIWVRNVAEAAASYSKDPTKLIAQLEKEMKEAAANLDFEAAARLRDELFEIKAKADGNRSRARSSLAAIRVER